MVFQFDYGTLSEAQEVDQLGGILSQCFNSPPSSEATFISRIGVENLRAIRQDGQMAGGLAILKMGQWYGGACVPMAGIAGVGIAPEYRGSGAAIALMQRTVQELQETGMAISVLYPAIQRLYRKAGYEQGGSRCIWEIEPQRIQVRDYTLPVQPISLERDWFATLYRHQVCMTNGHLERHRMNWGEILDRKEGAIVAAYRLGSESNPEGYVVIQQWRSGDRSLLLVRDSVLRTPAAVRRFWTFLSDHRSQIDLVRWRGAMVDNLTLVLPEQTARLQDSDRWFLRILNVQQALEQRGYPAAVDAELHLEVQDDLLPDNNGRFVLSVVNGQGSVNRGGRGDLQVDIRGLSPLYSGFFSPHQLQMTGYLEATASAQTTATQLFTGISPWMPDFF